MSIVAVPRVAVVAFAVVYATMLANEAKAQSRAPRQETLPQLVRFCPSWAEAHERALASLDNGRPTQPVRWKGCVWSRKGARVDVVDSDDSSTEIIYKGEHWFADDPLF